MTFKALALLTILAARFPSCGDEKDHTAEMEHMKEQIFKDYPSTESISIKIDHSTAMIIVLGNKQLYKATDAKKHQTANDLGILAIESLGKDNGIETGTLILTNDGRNESFTPADGLTTTINMDSLNKAKNPNN